MQNNKPVSFDFHGDVPFTDPFESIAKSDIHLYIDLDTYVGSKTCGQACSHCWFVNYDKVKSKSFAEKDAKNIVSSLRGQGYTVYPRYTDSFAYKGALMKEYGPAHNREFRYDDDHKATETMELGDAWTSGRPLMDEDYKELLDLARDSGYGTISITYHGVLNEDCSIQDAKNYPIKGVFSGQEFESVAARINEYNSSVSVDKLPKFDGKTGFRINVGLTLGKHNFTREHLIRYVDYFNAMEGIETVRFNRFHDHGGRHPELCLTDGEVVQVYQDLKWIHENVKLNFQLGVSEDFGTHGIEVMEFPAHVGWCRAGRQLFTVIPCDELVIEESVGLLVEKIGEVTACVNIFEPHLGIMVRKTHVDTNEVNYDVQFDVMKIERFTNQRMDGTYTNGCFAEEVSQELKAKKAINVNEIEVTSID